MRFSARRQEVFFSGWRRKNACLGSGLRFAAFSRMKCATFSLTQSGYSARLIKTRIDAFSNSLMLDFESIIAYLLRAYWACLID